MVPAAEEEMEGEEDCARWDYQRVWSWEPWAYVLGRPRPGSVGALALPTVWVALSDYCVALAI